MWSKMAEPFVAWYEASTRLILLNVYPTQFQVIDKKGLDFSNVFNS